MELTRILHIEVANFSIIGIYEYHNHYKFDLYALPGSNDGVGKGECSGRRLFDRHTAEGCAKSPRP
jgi:hypothetical protein